MKEDPPPPQNGAALLGQQGAPVGLHLLQAFAQVAVSGLQLVDPVQSRAELRGRQNNTTQVRDRNPTDGGSNRSH